MQLAHALRITAGSPPPRIALVGAGGKTTAAFRLARELLAQHPSRPVIVTTTTHLAPDQARLADLHWVLNRAEDVPGLKTLPPGVILFTGPAVGDGPEKRLGGLDPQRLQAVLALADARLAPLLIEADGARRLPVKAPGPHEPALPEWVDTVLVVVGLSGMGRPIAHSVHRPERFVELSGPAAADIVTVEALARLLTSHQGGLKNIPPRARRVALLNQADDPPRQALASRLADLLLAAGSAFSYHLVLAASLAPEMPSRPEAPGEGVSVWAAYEPAAAVLLAAGGSQRMGRPKQLLDWYGEPFVRRVARTALAAGLLSVTVITGAYADQVQAALEGVPVHLVHNPDWEQGQGGSVALGVRSLPQNTGSAIFLLSDQPQVPALLLRSLLASHAETLAPVIAPLADGQRANPVLFDRQTFPDLQALSGEAGGRTLFSRYRVEWLPWHDANLLLDVDTEADYTRLLASAAPGER